MAFCAGHWQLFYAIDRSLHSRTTEGSELAHVFTGTCPRRLFPASAVYILPISGQCDASHTTTLRHWCCSPGKRNTLEKGENHCNFSFGRIEYHLLYVCDDSTNDLSELNFLWCRARLSVAKFKWQIARVLRWFGSNVDSIFTHDSGCNYAVIDCFRAVPNVHVCFRRWTSHDHPGYSTVHRPRNEFRLLFECVESAVYKFHRYSREHWHRNHIVDDG